MRYSWLLLLFIAQLSFAQKKQITLEDVWKNNTFRAKTVPGFNAMKDGKSYTQIDVDGEKQTIRVYDLKTGKQQKTLFDNGQTLAGDTRVKIDDYAFSANEQKMLLKSESQNIYRHSVLNKIYVYDITANSLQQLDNGKVLHATFSPDGSKVAFVKDNNLYYKDLANGETVAVTSDGMKNSIINGNCDWVYEEEFSFTRAFDWSPDGKYLAYYRFDESGVPQYIMPMFTGLYPNNYTYKYPKAGEPNSVIQVKIYDVAKGATATCDIGSETDQYIPRIKWTKDPSKLCIFRLNRLQNKLELLLANASDGHSQVIYDEVNPYYIEIDDNLSFLPDNRSFIFNSETSGNTHLYRWDWKSKGLTALTKGNYDIDHIVGIDEKREKLYYTAAENPLERKLYVVDWNGKNKKELTPEPGTHAITQIKGFNYFLDRYSTLNMPSVYYLRDSKGKIVRILEDNAALKGKMLEYDMGTVSFRQLEIGNGRTLNAWVMTPPGFDDKKKYPVLMYQYSGPGSQEVADRFPVRDFFWHQMLAQKGYIIVCADGTGTGFRGQAFKKETYLQLGKYESDDQIAAAKYLGRLSYVDKDRIGIWGWSYGGFMSSTCIFKANDVFKMAIAVAPVSNWRYYDNIYTERYMRTPQQNEGGYDENAPEKMAANLKGKFLLIHGTGDDNVHFQNSIMLTDALIKANKEFDGEYYPNRSHGISGGNTRYHLYKKMTDFVLSNL
jgi:dipeptidyl-peptidase-4